MRTAVSGDDLRQRIKQLRITYREAAERLGLTLDGLNKQMTGANPVSRQTELLLGWLEKYPPPKRVKVVVKVTELMPPVVRIRRPTRARRR